MGARHASIFWYSSHPDAFEALSQFKGLRTLLLLGDSRDSIKGIPKEMFNSLVCLWVLDLRHSQISGLLDTVGNLVHLRYLGLYDTPIVTLPESVSCLYNLQVLELGECYMLQELPSGTRKLLNLRHLDLACQHKRSELAAMPAGIGQLTNLQTLSRFMVGSKTYGSGIEELKNLTYLRGEICLSNLENVTDARDVEETNLKDKQYLSRVELRWDCSVGGNKVLHVTVLDKLQPHANLNELEIHDYGGVQLASWMSEALFSNLVTIRLLNCHRCRFLPPLGKLRTLSSLTIGGFNGVECVGCEFCGSDSEGNLQPFPSLKTLTFHDMLNFWSWFDGEFPCLSELEVVNCPKLIQLPPTLPSLGKLEARNCQELIIRRTSLPCLDSLVLLHCNNLVLCQPLHQPQTGLPPRLTHLRIGSFPHLDSLPEELQCLTTLQDLEIEDCPEFRSLPEMIVLASLERLEIWNCPKLQNLPLLGLPASLQFLSLNGCPLLKKKCRDSCSYEFGVISKVLWVWIDGEPFQGTSFTFSRGRKVKCCTQLIETTRADFAKNVQRFTGMKAQIPLASTTESLPTGASFGSDIEEDGRDVLVSDYSIIWPGEGSGGQSSEMGYTAERGEESGANIQMGQTSVRMEWGEHGASSSGGSMVTPSKRFRHGEEEADKEIEEPSEEPEPVDMG